VKQQCLKASSVDKKRSGKTAITKRSVREVKSILAALMTMDYVRVRMSTLKDVQELLEERRKTDWHVLAAIFGLVVIVALTGLVLSA
jgi:hypothetical protein